MIPKKCVLTILDFNSYFFSAINLITDLNSNRLSEIKFLFSEKATNHCEISTLLLSTVHTDKSKVEILQNFVAFSEYMNLKLQSCALKFGQLPFQDYGKTIHSAEKIDTSYKMARFFTEMKQEKNSKWPT